MAPRVAKQSQIPVDNFITYIDREDPRGADLYIL